MQGYKTWTGILLAVLGALGITEILGAENVSGFIDTLLQLIGFAIAIYGNLKAHREIDSLGGYSK